MSFVHALLRGKALISHNHNPLLTLCLDRPSEAQCRDAMLRLDRIDARATFFLDPESLPPADVIHALDMAGHEIGCFMGQEQGADAIGRAKALLESGSDGLMVQSVAFAGDALRGGFRRVLADQFSLIRLSGGALQGRVVDAHALTAVSADDPRLDSLLVRYLKPKRWLILSLAGDDAALARQWAHATDLASRMRAGGGVLLSLRNAAGLASHIIPPDAAA